MERQKKNNKDRSVTVRFSSDVMNVIDDLAREYKVTRSDIIRLAADNSLARYLAHVRYVIPEQGRVINSNIIKLGNVMSEVLYNLKRISANMDKMNEGKADVLQGGNIVTGAEMNELISRIERVSQKVGEELNVFKN